MNKEIEIIKQVLEILPKSKFVLNNFFESDAEIINYKNNKLLFSLDEFSQEDFFSDDDPYELGKNISIATISDILASGGIPLFYAHSITIKNEKWNKNFIELFTKGVAEILKESNVGFIGGDLGTSKLWKYTGVVVGEVENPITRLGATEGNLIYMTGQLGAGNIEAAKKLYLINHFQNKALNLPKLKLKLRNKESDFINQYATSCIDSSDGVLSALNTISDINQVGYKITNLPYSEEGIIVCEFISKPKCLLFMGECGEYELVFTIKKELKDRFTREAIENHLSFTQIGEIQSKNQKLLHTEDDYIDLLNYEIRARDYTNISEYLSELINYVENNRK